MFLIAPGMPALARWDDAGRTLRNLEFAGLIARRVTGSKPIAGEYSLTQLGKTIIVPLRGMCHWARRYHRR